MFLKETLRMRPPISGTTSRTVLREEGLEMAGYHLPQGTSVTPSIWAYHYDERCSTVLVHLLARSLTFVHE